MSANRVTYDAGGNPFPTRADLWGASTFYHGGEAYTPTNHDYALVSADEGAASPFTGGQTWHEFDGTQWAFAMGINEEPFTAAENAAIGSGITSRVRAFTFEKAAYQGSLGYEQLSSFFCGHWNL